MNTFIIAAIVTCVIASVACGAGNPIQLQATLCLGNMSIIIDSAQNCATVAASQVWWNMTQLGATTVVVGVNNFVVPLPLPSRSDVSLVSFQMMWLAAASCRYNSTKRNNTVAYYANITRVPLYVNAFGGLTIVPQAFFVTFNTMGFSFTPSFDGSDVTVRVAQSHSSIIVEYTKGQGCDCYERGDFGCYNMTGCMIALQTQVDRYGADVSVVVKTLDASFVSNGTGAASVQIVTSATYPLLGTAVNGTISQHLSDGRTPADPINGTTTVFALQRDDAALDVCLAASTCEDCVAVGCVFAHNINRHGVCLPGPVMRVIDSTTPVAFRINDCRAFADVTLFGPCFQSQVSCVVHQSLDADFSDADTSFHVSLEPMIAPNMSFPLVELGTVTGCVPSQLSSNSTRSLQEISVQLLCATSQEVVIRFNASATTSSQALLHLPFICQTLAAPESVSWSKANMTQSQWCRPPYIHIDRSCHVTTFAFNVTPATVPVTYLVQYFHESGVLAVHTISSAGIHVVDNLMSTFVEVPSSRGGGSSTIAATASEYFTWAPNRSTYFVAGYQCLIPCVHGSCDSSGGVCVCSDPTQWTGASCDVPVGMFIVNDKCAKDAIVRAECPTCLRGNCTTNGTCSCEEGYGGPRCELGCATASTRTCTTVTSLTVCNTCVCFAGTASNASTMICSAVIGCVFSRVTDALLSNSTCPDINASLVPTTTVVPSLAPRAVQQANSSSPWTRTNALAVILALCVSALLLSVVMQLLNFRRRARRAGKMRAVSSAGPMEGVRHLLPAPQLTNL